MPARTRLARFILCVLFGCGLAAGQGLFAQNIILFSLEPGDAVFPAPVLANANGAIRSALAEVSRFRIVAQTRRESKEKSAGLAAWLAGGENKDIDAAYSETEKKRIHSALLFVLPAIDSYTLETREGETSETSVHEARLWLSLTFINREKKTPGGQIFLETSGENTSEDSAVEDALKALPALLAHELPKIEEFRALGGIVHVMNGEALFDFLPKNSPASGDSYTVIRARDGAEEEIAFIIVKEVQENYAVAQIVASSTTPQPGDEVRKTAAASLEATAYGGVFLWKNYTLPHIPLAGIKATLSRWVFYTRPIVEIEFPLIVAHPSLKVFDVVPTNFFLGLEITNLYFWRFQLAPTLLFGVSASRFGPEARLLFEAEGSLLMTHAGGKAALALSLLVSPHIKISAEAGFLVMLSIRDSLTNMAPDGYLGRPAGPYFTLGLTFK